MNAEAVASQDDISAEIAGLQRSWAAGSGAEPRLEYPPYRSSILRHPKKPLVLVEPEEIERGAPCFGERDVDPADADLTAGHPGEPIGERIIVTGRLLDGVGAPVGGPLIEVWRGHAPR